MTGRPIRTNISPTDGPAEADGPPEGGHDARSDEAGPSVRALVEPLSIDEFVAAHWRRRHLFSSGEAGRFAGLLSWPAFNRILEHHWREPHRFRLSRKGRDLEPASYADLTGSTPRILSKALTDHLRAGATLAFHAIDEVHEPLTRLAECVEAFFEADVQINAYAGWRATHGLDVHHDDEEIFILQVDGRKHWRLFGSDAQAVVFDRILCAGDGLYIPRGCDHLAIPVNEPTLHLAVGVRNPGAGVKERPIFGLPWSATAEGLPGGRHFRVALSGSARVTGADASAIDIRCRNRTYRFPRSMRLVIERLAEETSVPMSHLLDALSGQLDEDDVRLLLAMLAQAGLVAIIL